MYKKMIIITNIDTSEITRFCVPDQKVHKDLTKWIASNINEGGVTIGEFDYEYTNDILTNRSQQELDRVYNWLGRYYATQVNAQ